MGLKVSWLYCFVSLCLHSIVCTERNVGERVLLRMEKHLSEMKIIQREILNSQQSCCQNIQLRNRLPECHPPFEKVSNKCLFLEVKKKMSWSEARKYCQNLNADLLTIKDATEFQVILKWINSQVTGQGDGSIWIGGSDIEEEGTWKWIDGSDMPLGPSFWAIRENTYEPNNSGGKEHTAELWRQFKYFINDRPQNAQNWPLCLISLKNNIFAKENQYY